jgi:hypothetical protein
MKQKNILYAIFILFLFLSPPVFSQSKPEPDSLYNRLRHKDINKMTQREYDYFMLMKRGEVKGEPSIQNKQSRLTGVVTYYFNENFGDRPDVGAEVYILSEKHKSKCNDVMIFFSEVLGRNVTEKIKELELDVPNIIKLMKKSSFDSLESRVSIFIDKLRYGKISDAIKVIADGDGSFSAVVKPGHYYFIVRSAHRNSYSNKVELLAQLGVEETEVKEGATKSVKIRFTDR